MAHFRAAEPDPDAGDGLLDGEDGDATAVVDDDLPPALDGERLDRVVSLLAAVSRSRAATAVADGLVRLDGVPATQGSLRVRAGQHLRVDAITVTTAVPVADASVVVPVLHADDHVIVVDKPAGLVVHPGAGHAGGTMVNGLLARFPELAGVGEPHRPGVVHRLDRGTSGLLVVARTAEAYQHLVDQLAARTVERRYSALVWGVPSASHGVIDAPVGRSARDPERMAVTDRGRPARTRYDVVATFRDPADLALLACRLETGRTHQIRVHLDAIGHPVVEDPTYHGVRHPLAHRLGRPFLHAEHLAFRHPVTGAAMAFDSPLPPDLAALLAQLS